MNELKSYTEYAVSTPTADFVIGFDFNYGEDAVNVTVDDVPATTAGYTVVYLNETTIQLSPSVPSGVVRLQRETNIDQTDHAYRAGAKFIAQTMDENFEQLRHSQQEVRDGFSKLSTDTNEIIAGLDTALELAQDAAQDAQDAAVIAQGAADTVNTIIVEGKVGAGNVLDASGLNQQYINDSSKLLSSNVLDFFTEAELIAWKADPNTFDASDAIIRAQTLSPSAKITFPTGTFRITKKIPSPKHWVGVYGGFDPHGTLILVDNVAAIDGVIDVTANSTDIKLQGIFFKGVQNRLHTLYKSKNGYIVRHKSLRVDSFAYGFISKGTYDFFDDCYFNDNAVGIKPVAFNSTNQSTMFGYRNCVFTYNAKALDVSQTDGFGSYEDWINILFESCGFEANEYGIYATQRMWYVTLLNCWFENNSVYGLYSPTSHVLEINTRHNANSPRLVDETNTSTLFGMIASLVDLEIKGHVLSDVKFPEEYSPTGEAFKGKTISQRFTDDGGGVVAEVAFVREKNLGNYGGSGIEFSTAQSTLTPTLIARWGISQSGTLYPKQNVTYNIGSAASTCNAVYTAKIMYTETVGDFFGGGSPEGVVTASVGSTYRRIDGAAGQPTFYTKESGLGNTGWKAVTVVA